MKEKLSVNNMEISVVLSVLLLMSFYLLQSLQ